MRIQEFITKYEVTSPQSDGLKEAAKFWARNDFPEKLLILIYCLTFGVYPGGVENEDITDDLINNISKFINDTITSPNLLWSSQKLDSEMTVRVTNLANALNTSFNNLVHQEALNREQGIQQSSDSLLQAIANVSNELQSNLNNLGSSLTIHINDQVNALTNAIDQLTIIVQQMDTRNDLALHTNNTTNPHNVTKEQVGLGNVLNTLQLTFSDVVDAPNIDSPNVPVSAKQVKLLNESVENITSSINNLATLINNITSSKGNANGIATLDSNAKVPASQIPAYNHSLQIVNSISDRNNLSPTENLLVYVKDASIDPTVVTGGAFYLYELASTSWIKLSEMESLDIIQDWVNIQNKPTEFPPKSHSHDMHDIIDHVHHAEEISSLEEYFFIPGDLKESFRSSMKGRWLLCDGRTIGNQFSNATALASVHSHSLFFFLWGLNSPNLALTNSNGQPVSRGVSASADFHNNKQIQLFDLRGRFKRMAGISSNGVNAKGDPYDGGVVGRFYNDKFQHHYHDLRLIRFFAPDRNPRQPNIQQTFSPNINTDLFETNGFVGNPSQGDFGLPRTGSETHPTYIAVNTFIRY